MLTLFYSPGACSLAAHIVLEELNLNYQAVKVDLKTHLTENSEDYYQLNPYGSVPMLQLEDKYFLTQNTAILIYLGELDYSSQLMPQANTIERFHCYEYLSFISADLHKSFGPLFKPAAYVELPDAHLMLQQQAIKNIQRYLSVMEKKLLPNQFALNENFSVVDAYLFVISRWLAHFKIDTINAFPKFYQLAQKISAVPSVQRALQKEGLA